MPDLRQLLVDAEPFDDRGFLDAEQLRHESGRRARARIVKAVVAVLALALVLPLGLAWLGAPRAAPVSPAPPVRGLEQTVWFVDFAASGISEDPRVLPRANHFWLTTVLQLDSGGQLQVGSAYRLFWPRPAGAWTGVPETDARLAAGATGLVAFDVPVGLGRGYDQDVRCTEASCPAEALPYWPATKALDRLLSVVRYDVVPGSSQDVPTGTGSGLDLRLYDADGGLLLVLHGAAYDATLEAFSHRDNTPSCGDGNGGPAYCPGE